MCVCVYAKGGKGKEKEKKEGGKRTMKEQEI